MSDFDSFADALGKFVHRAAYTPGQLASLTAVPKTTIVNWLRGRVQRPRQWQGIVALAAAMRLTEPEANELLHAAQHPTIAALRQGAGAEGAQQFAFWATAVSAPAPFQTIALPPYFVGRAAELEAIQIAFEREPHTAVICLHGMAGVGKTSLAAQLAYQLRTHFADGVLWARLDSSDTMTILATFAHAYAQDVSQYRDIASRSRVVRDLLQKKQVLIVLDNAQTSDQVEPLLPPTGRCAVLVTTRRQDLAVLAGAKRFEIRPFSPTGASLDLFAQILGAERAVADAGELAQIAATLGHLPLALVITASRLAYEPGWDTAQFHDRIQSVQERLRTMQFEAHNVRRSFQLSYALLDQPARDVFSAAGLLARQAFSAAPLAALTGLDTAVVMDALRQLFSLSLMQGGENGRFYLHPLLHDYAHSLPHPPDAPARLVAYWLDFVTEHVYAHQAIAKEMGHIEVALAVAFKAEMERPLWQMLNHLMPTFIAHGTHDQAVAHLKMAHTLLTEKGNAVGLGWINLRLGQLYRHHQAFDEAEPILQSGLKQARERADRRQMARFLVELGIICNCQHRYSLGKTYLTEALPLARAEPPSDTLLNLLEELGILALIENDKPQAEAYYAEGLALARSSGRQTHEVLFLKGVGALRHLTQSPVEANALFEEGFRLAQRIGFRRGSMLMGNNLGVAHFFAGNLSTAEQ